MIIDAPVAQRVRVPSNAAAPLRAGLVFVPCALCQTPVDLATVGSREKFALCAGHAPLTAPLAVTAA